LKVVTIIKDTLGTSIDDINLIDRACDKLQAKGYSIRSSDPFNGVYKSMDMGKVTQLLRLVPNLKLQEGLAPYYASAISCLLGEDLKSRSELVLGYIPRSDMVGLSWITCSIAKQLGIKVWNIYEDEARKFLIKSLGNGQS
jgi:hypothetical protein